MSHEKHVHADTSLTGWAITDRVSPSRGLWHKSEIDHINILELKAFEIDIYTYYKNKLFSHTRVMCDNATDISYITTWVEWNW